MRLLAHIEREPVIERILRHLDLWEEPARPRDRGPPETTPGTDQEPFADDLPFGPDTYAE
jgi:hypothetical protein